jgi:hypothetical protein
MYHSIKVVKDSPTTVSWQGTNKQVEATKEGADTTGVENGTWSSDVLLMSLNLLYDGTPSTTVMLDTPFVATRYQCTSTKGRNRLRACTTQ